MLGIIGRPFEKEHYELNGLISSNLFSFIHRSDAFEVGNNKKALHETEKVLKKTPNLRCARALKGLALMRLSKNEESNAIINQIVGEKPSDEATMQVLSYIYKEMEECKSELSEFFLLINQQNQSFYANND